MVFIELLVAGSFSGTVPPHAATHKAGGTDAILIDELGAPTDNTNNNVTTSHHGFVPKASGNATEFLAGDATWKIPAGSGGSGGTGEANTYSNAGLTGVGVVLVKSGVDLPFKSIAANSNKIAVSNDATNKAVNIDVTEANLTLSNIGGAITSFQAATGTVFQTSTQTVSNKTIPTDTNFIKHSTTNNAGDLLANTGTVFDRFAVGAANQLLAVNAAGNNIAWKNPIFASSTMQIQNPAGTFAYILVGSAITANRNVTLPLLTGNDTFAFTGFNNTWSAVQNFPNLSTVGTNIVLSNTGLTTARTFTFPDSTTTLVGTADSRLSDARTPTAHATTHSSGGSDPITLSNLAGAVTTGQLPSGIPHSKVGTNLILSESGLTAIRTVTFPDSTGLVVYSTDSRLSDARTPTAHKTTHQTGGSDAIPLDTLAATTDVTTLNSTTTAHGLLPKLSGNASEYLNGGGTFSVPSGTGTGEANTASNQGTGAGWFKAKSGVDLQFKSFIMGSTKLALTSNVNDLTVDVTEANLNIANMTGSIGDSRITDLAYTKLTGVPSSTGEANTYSNAGTAGIGITLTKSGVDLPFKAINVASTKLSVANNATNKTVDLDVVESNLNIANQTGSIGDARITDLAYTKLTSVPSTFAPSAHKSTHVSGGSDAFVKSDVLSTVSRYVEILGSDPASDTGRIWAIGGYIKYHDTSGNPHYIERLENKGIANGYCDLDASTLVPLTRISGLTNTQISATAAIAHSKIGTNLLLSETGLTAARTITFPDATTTLVGTADSRLSDARTPTAHKATHVSGGTDAFAKTDILTSVSRYIELIGTDPASADTGRVWVNGADLKFWDNTAVTPVKQTAERLANKGVASGYCDLDSSTLVPLTRISGLTNTQIAAGASIAYSKLNLATSIVNADIAAAAAIAYTKLALTGTIVNTDIATGAAIAYSKLALGTSIVNGDIATAAAIAYSKLGTNLKFSETGLTAVRTFTFPDLTTTLVGTTDARLSDARTPTAHKTTHQSGGTDAIPLDTLAATTDITTLNSSTTAHGLLKKLDNTATHYMDGTGNWSGAVPATPVSGLFLYYVYRDATASKYKALNLDTNVIDYQSTDLTDCKATVLSVLTAASTAGRSVVFGPGQFTFLSQLDLSGLYVDIQGHKETGSGGGAGNTTTDTVWKKNYTDTTNGFVKSYADVTYTKQRFTKIVIQGDDNGIGFDGYAYNERYGMFHDVMICHFATGYKARKVWQCTYYDLHLYYCKTQGILLDTDGLTGDGKEFNNYFYGGEVRFTPINVYLKSANDTAFYSMMLEGSAVTANSINYTTTNNVKIDSGTFNTRLYSCSFETPGVAGIDIITDAGEGTFVNACRFGGVYTGNQVVYRTSGLRSNFTNNFIEPYTINSTASIILNSGAGYCRIIGNGETGTYVTGTSLTITDNSGNSSLNTILDNNTASATIANTVGTSTTFKNNLTVNGQTQALTTAAQNFESVAKFSITGTTDGLTIDNGYNEAGVFCPIFRSTVTSANAANYHNPIYFQSVITAANDTGTEPITVFSNKLATGALIATRPLVGFRNGVSSSGDVIHIYPTYMDLKGNQVKNAVINSDNNTLKHSTTNALGDLLVGNGTKFDRRARGTNGQVLTATATDIAWQTPAGGATFIDSYTYTVYNDAGTIKARNNKTGVIDFSNANLDPVITSIIATADVSLEIQSGTYNLSSGFAGWSVASAATIKLQQDTVVKVPNAYTGYVWSYGSTIQYSSIEGGRYDEQGTPASNWTCFKFQPGTPNGAFQNTIKDTSVLHANYAIHLLTNTLSWINSNYFENIFANQCKYLVFFEHTSTFTAQTSGSNGNHFVNCVLQSAASGPQVLGGIVNVNGWWNKFDECLIWDIAASNASAASMTITANANHTIVIGGILTNANYSNSGADTMVLDAFSKSLPTLYSSNTFTGFNYYNITAAGGFENVAKWSVGSSADYLSITNNVSATGSFASLIQANQSSTNADRFTPGLYFQNIAKSVTDLADGESNIIFGATITGPSAFVNRPLFSFRNGISTDVLQVFPTYSDFKNNSIKNAGVKANENTLSGVSQDPIVKRTGRAQPISTVASPTAITAVNLVGILSGHTPTGPGTNTNTWDTTEGLLVNWITTTTINQNAGLVSPTAGIGIARRAFATRFRIRSKIDTVAGSVSRFYFGFTSLATLPISDTPLATTDSGVMVGFRSSDTNYTIFTNSGGGAALTATALSTPIAKDTAFHTIEINWTAGGNANIIFDGVTTTVSTALPATTTNLFFNAVAQNATAAIRTHSVKGIWAEIAG